MTYDKSLIRMANRIQDALKRLRSYRYVELLNRLKTLFDKVHELYKETRLMQVSLVKGWSHASEDCCNSLVRILNEIPPSVSHACQLAGLPSKEVPRLSELIDELEQLKQELDGVEFGISEGAISVETEPITLEGIYLGPFKIELHLKRLAELYKGAAYNVIALDPHPAATSEDVTHPHVSSGQLCEGEGSAAIKAALEEGRLWDFFTLVRSILNTYSPDSPYVSLPEWDGVACYNCGYICSGDSCYFCSFCDKDYCEECIGCCSDCSETICSGCATRCFICDELLCPHCVCNCERCGDSCCGSCMDGDICKDCKESEVQNEKKDDDVPADGQIPAATQPDTSAKETSPAAGGKEPPGLEIQPSGMGEARLLPG